MGKLHEALTQYNKAADALRDYHDWMLRCQFPTGDPFGRASGAGGRALGNFAAADGGRAISAVVFDQPGASQQSTTPWSKGASSSRPC